MSEDDAVKWVQREASAKGVTFSEDAARELVDALNAEMLTVSSELEKLLLYAGAMKRPAIEVADVETMVFRGQAAKLVRVDGRDQPERHAARSGFAGGAVECV